MGAYKKFDDSDILYNHIATQPHTTMFHLGTYMSGAIDMLNEEPYQYGGNIHQYVGWEEGDVRATISRYNLTGAIDLREVTTIADEGNRYHKTILTLLSGSAYRYNAFISGIQQGLSNKMVVVDISSVYYDQKIGDAVFGVLPARAKGSFEIEENFKYITDYYAGGPNPIWPIFAHTSSFICYHDHSGALKYGNVKYLYKDDDGHWRYNILASKGDSSTLNIMVDNYYGDTMAVGNNEVAGYLLPEEGLAIFWKTASYSAFDSFQHITFSSFDGYQEIPVTTYLCKAGKGELNYSNNPTYYKSGSQGQMYHSGTNTAYITKIGLYNKERKLVGVASLAQPIRKKPSEQVLFKLTLHR